MISPFFFIEEHPVPDRRAGSISFFLRPHSLTGFSFDSPKPDCGSSEKKNGVPVCAIASPSIFLLAIPSGKAALFYCSLPVIPPQKEFFFSPFPLRPSTRPSVADGPHEAFFPPSSTFRPLLFFFKFTCQDTCAPFYAPADPFLS